MILVNDLAFNEKKNPLKTFNQKHQLMNVNP